MYYNFDGTPLIKNPNEPYSDDYMTFDEMTGHYVLTEKAIAERCAIDIRARLSDNKTINPEIVINKICRTVSDQIYNFIHGYSIYDKRQDCMIAGNPYLRSAIQRAMEYQAEFLLGDGDLYLSIDNNDIGKEIHRMSQRILIDSGICYSGV